MTLVRVTNERRKSKRNQNERENKKIKRVGRKEQKGGSVEASKRRPFTIKTFMHASVVADLVSGSWAILGGSTVRKI